MYRKSFQRIVKLLANPKSPVPRAPLEALFRALEKRVVPVAVRRLYDRQRKTVDIFEAVLLGLLDDFEDDLESALAEESDLEERKGAARERVNALAFWMVMAAWEWFHYGFALGKLSVHFSASDLLVVAWSWHQNMMFVYRRLAPDLAAALVEAIEKGESIEPVLRKFRWRVAMYAGAMWGVVQKAALYRPPPEERVRAEEPWTPSISWWTFPLMAVAAFPLLWETPSEWGVPDELAPDTPAWEIAQKQVYWTGTLDEATCVGERGCWPKIGKVWHVATLQIHNWFPGVMDCFSNCRCGVIPADWRGEIPRGVDWYQWAF